MQRGRTQLWSSSWNIPELITRVSEGPEKTDQRTAWYRPLPRKDTLTSVPLREHLCPSSCLPPAPLQPHAEDLQWAPQVTSHKLTAPCQESWAPTPVWPIASPTTVSYSFLCLAQEHQALWWLKPGWYEDGHVRVWGEFCISPLLPRHKPHLGLPLLAPSGIFPRELRRIQGLHVPGLSTTQHGQHPSSIEIRVSEMFEKRTAVSKKG